MSRYSTGCASCRATNGAPQPPRCSTSSPTKAAASVVRVGASGSRAGIFELRVRQDYGTILRNAGIPIPKQEQEEAKQRHPDILLRIFCYPHGNKLV
ncbi:MAG: hypothetical protein ACRDLA_07915, partial [Thermoleophilaceae bacterium]